MAQRSEILSDAQVVEVFNGKVQAVANDLLFKSQELGIRLPLSVLLRAGGMSALDNTRCTSAGLLEASETLQVPDEHNDAALEVLMHYAVRLHELGWERDVSTLDVLYAGGLVALEPRSLESVTRTAAVYREATEHVPAAAQVCLTNAIALFRAGLDSRVSIHELVMAGGPDAADGEGCVVQRIKDAAEARRGDLSIASVKLV
jgi:hypothetical protein